MFKIRLVISIAAIIASCHASVGHIVPAVRSVPIVRYAPFYNFPNGVRSIHAVASPVAAPHLLPAPAPVFSAPAPLLPAPAPVLPAPAPIFPAPAPVFHAPAPVFPAPAPVFPAPAPIYQSGPVLPAPASIFSPAAPLYPRIAPIAPILAHGFPLSNVPFSPIVRPVAAPVPAPLFTPGVAPPPVAVTRAAPFSISSNAPAPVFKQFAWK